MTRTLLLLLACSVGVAGADLTGNWAAREPLPDGTERRTYFDLKQEGDKITGHVRTGQMYYTVNDSSGTPENFTLNAGLLDGNSNRTVKYEGKLVGDELHVMMRRRANMHPVEVVAHRAPAGEGAMPAQLPLPTLHKVPYNGLAKTPPMGWNSWNKFAGRVSDAGVRGVADAMASSGMRDAGYIYVNIDDTWEGDRDAQTATFTPTRNFRI